MDKPNILSPEGLACDSCGTAGAVFYKVEFYILPTRLVRKRHKDRGRTGIYCRPCHEREPDLAVELNGNTVTVPKAPRRGKDALPPCLACGKAVTLPGLYALLTSVLVMSGSFVENFVLAALCADCAETRKIDLPRRL